MVAAMERRPGEADPESGERGDTRRPVGHPVGRRRGYGIAPGSRSGTTSSRCASESTDTAPRGPRGPRRPRRRSASGRLRRASEQRGERPPSPVDHEHELAHPLARHRHATRGLHDVAGPCSPEHRRRASAGRAPDGQRRVWRAGRAAVGPALDATQAARVVPARRAACWGCRAGRGRVGPAPHLLATHPRLDRARPTSAAPPPASARTARTPARVDARLPRRRRAGRARRRAPARRQPDDRARMVQLAASARSKDARAHAVSPDRLCMSPARSPRRRQSRRRAPARSIQIAAGRLPACASAMPRLFHALAYPGSSATARSRSNIASSGRLARISAKPRLCRPIGPCDARSRSAWSLMKPSASA